MPESIYLDYAATTPLDPRVAAQMAASLYSPEQFGNPSSRHADGFTAAKLVEVAQQQIAVCIHAPSAALTFTSGATEANNLAIKGIAEFHRRRGKHIICCAADHKAILDPCAHLASQGYSISYLKPQPNGLIDLAELAATLQDDTILVSTVYVNSETGVVQNAKAIIETAHARGVYCHLDGAQAVGKIAVDVQQLNVDLMSFSAHKVYGPKGVGALYIKPQPRVRLTAQMHGGGHQHGIRSGTLATHQIIGMGAAFALAEQQLVPDQQHAERLRDILWVRLQTLDGVFLHSPHAYAVPHIINVSFAQIDNQALLEHLTNLAISTGSACTSGSTEPSYVLRAMGIAREVAAGAVRISFGRFTTVPAVETAAQLIIAAVKRLRA